MASRARLFARQTWALTKKTLLIAVVRHWFSTLLRAVILPILFMALLSNIKNFLIARNGFGVGSPLPVHSLAYNLPANEKLVFVQPPGLGPDVETVVKKIADPLRAEKKFLVFLTEPEELVTTCRESLQGVSDCFAAVVFNDSPLTVGKNSIWNYTIRTDSALSGGSFSASYHNNDPERVNLPFQVAIDNAITNSTIIPNEYLYTSISQATQDNDIRKTYQSLIISTYGIAFFIGLVSSIYHMVGMITTERESGMTQLIDAMGGSAAARICSYVLAFNIMYLPSWIVIGALFWVEVFRTSSAAILIFWQIFTGMAITSASTLAAMFFNRAQLSGIYSILGFLVLAVVGQIVDHGNASTGTVAILSLLFPSMNYMFMIGYMARYELQNLPTNMVRAANATPDQSSRSSVSGIVLWVFLWLQVIIYPILAVYVEKSIHGVRSKGRTIDLRSEQSSSAAIELSGLTKVYPRTFCQKWLTRGHTEDVVAVDNLSLVARRGQILCLLGANGSGKTTILEVIGGLQKSTKGSIHINAKPSQLGICPQRNVMWDELTVDEHVKIWNQIKDSQDDGMTLDGLIDACDLSLKKNARSETLSGGQKRKLQLACMFVGGSSVCLLDEVSSGLDPVSRRVIWNIVLAERSKRTMVLTTHFLDEADVLADHIAIISLGHLQCEGSAVELKSRFGGGYRVHLQGQKSGPDLGFLTKHLWDHTVYNAPDSAGAAVLLSALDSHGYSDVFVNGPTVEDVFLRVAHGTYAAQDASVKGDDSNLTPTRSRAVSEVSMKLSSGQGTSFIRQIQILSRKRYTALLRNWLPYFFAFLIPIAATPALKTFLSSYNAPQCTRVSSTNSNPLQPLNIQYISEHIGNLQLLTGPVSVNQTLHHVLTEFPIGVGLNLSNYTNQFLFANSWDSFQQHVMDMYANTTPGALYMESNISTPTYAFVGDLGILPAMLMQNLWTQIRSGLPIAAYYAALDSLVPHSNGNSFQYITYFCLAQAVYPAFFALYPTFEKLRQVRALQYSNGVRALPMWVSYVLFDFLFVVVISTVCTIAVSQEAHWWFGPGYLFPVLMLYGLASTLFVYVISLYATSQLGAFAFAAGGEAVMFLLSLMAFILVETYTSSANLQGAVDATNFSLNIIFPIGNVVRALLVGLNVDLVNCRNNKYISNAGSIYAYGGPILYLCIQICFLFCFLLWAENASSLTFIRPRQYSEDLTEHELRPLAEEVKDEKHRVETSATDPLCVSDLTKRFGSNLAVDNISFGVGPGEVFALLGPNGAGKSVTISLIRGELRPDHGAILLEGTDIVKHTRTARKSLGVCPQFDALDLMTTREHLEFYASVKGVASVQQDVDTLMRKVGMEEYESRLASTLSGGNKRKLSLAIALIGNPKVLVLDEPSSSMDAASKRMMWKTLTEVKAGRSLLLTTHSMEEANALANRAGIISRRILTIGTTDFLRQKHGNVYYVHLVLKTAPTSTVEEMQRVERWIESSVAGVRFDSFGNYHGQIKFSLPAGNNIREGEDEEENQPDQIEPVNGVGLDDSIIVSVHRRRPPKKSGVLALFSLLEANKQVMGLEFYSVGATTLDQVFLNVVAENDVREEGYAIPASSGKRTSGRWWCF